MSEGRTAHVRRTGRLARVIAVFGLLVATLSGCSAAEVLRFGWPEGVTEQATQMRQIWTGSSIAALVVGAIVWGLIFWTCAFHRRKNSELPKQTAYNLPLEIILTVIPFLIISVLFYYTVVVQTEVQAQVSDPDVIVEVTGFQWNWEFQYADENVEETGEPISIVGDSTESAVLVLPIGTVRIELFSNDVIHSFWIPETLFKRDVIPGQNFGYDNTYDLTLDEEGAYVGRCAELCGIYHSAMNFEVRVVSPEVFEDYLAARASGMGNAEALESVGEPGLAQTTRPFDTDRTRRSATD
ncbi:MAG: cytochrome c oxidase subunit II [Geodermatophilaceae bacterium]|nr:cytochrome c oxidase subunit II [Geodermatophilaceae bacterium]